MKKRDSNRIAKVNAKIQKELGEILLDLLQNHDNLVTISRVETSRDMKWAKVWISIWGGEDQKILDFLQRHLYEIQKKLNHGFATKIIPKITFALDTSARYAQHINELINKLHEEEGHK